MAARRALLLLDGLDEGGQVRNEIDRHVLEVLAPQGHVLLCTSRPAGVDEARFAQLRRLRLLPLTARDVQESACAPPEVRVRVRLRLSLGLELGTVA